MVHILARRVKSGATLFELLFVCGLFALVLTVLTVLLQKVVASQESATLTGDEVVSMELSRLRIAEVLSQARLVSPTIDDGVTNQMVVRPFVVQPNGDPLLDAGGAPTVGLQATLSLDAEGRLILDRTGQDSVLSNMGEGAVLEIQRISPSRVRVRLETVREGRGEKELIFEAVTP